LFTKSDKNGFFQLQLPVGNHYLIMITGDGSKFRLVVSVSNDPVVSLNNIASVLIQVGAIAYVEVDYDDIQTIIHDSLGYAIIQIQPTDFRNLNYLKKNDVIFMNCGLQFNFLDSSEYVNVREYVINGGSLYGSDWAVGYLTGRTGRIDWMLIQSPSNRNHEEALANQ
jgi:hypothetical protein